MEDLNFSPKKRNQFQVVNAVQLDEYISEKEYKINSRVIDYLQSQKLLELCKDKDRIMAREFYKCKNY